MKNETLLSLTMLLVSSCMDGTGQTVCVKESVLKDLQARSECREEASLVSTSAGTPNRFHCGHPKHRIEVKGELVICRCSVRNDASPTN